MKTSLPKKIENLNIEELVKEVFPYNKDFKVTFKSYFLDGIAEWPTWFIVIYRGKILNDYILLTICEHSEYTRTKYLCEEFDLEYFSHQMNIAGSSRTLYTFLDKNQFIEEEHFLHINEMKRLYDYLAKNKIILFEPTE
ncbi:MAG: hypothetical protein ACOVRK_07545 [Chryseobacterium taeanense]|jgi:ABC-type uncharacterized transport system ATPase subunit